MDEKKSCLKFEWPGHIEWVKVDKASGRDKSVLVLHDETAKFTVVDYDCFLGYLREEGKMPYTESEIDNIFSYHKPSIEQVPKYEAIRSAARTFAKVIIANTNSSAEQTLAIRKLEEVVMRANQCVALRG